MFNLLVVFLIGMLISFLGSLPLGSLNISAMQIAGTERVRHAVFFSLGVVVVEVLYVRLSLQGIGWILQHRQLFYFMEWVTVFLFIALALGSFIAAFKRNSSQKNILLNNRLRRFWLGFTMSAVNPLQIPFWFIWSTYLISNNILHPVSVQYNIYTAGIATGTLAGLAVFIVAGKWLSNKLRASGQVINMVAGIVFSLSALLQMYQVLYRPFSFQFHAAASL